MKLKELWPVIAWNEPIFLYDFDTHTYHVYGEKKPVDGYGKFADYMDYYVIEIQGTFDEDERLDECSGWGVNVQGIGIGITITQKGEIKDDY